MIEEGIDLKNQIKNVLKELDFASPLTKKWIEICAPIYIEDPKDRSSARGIGTCFTILFRDLTFLVTAKHVLFDENGNMWGDTANLLGYTKDIEQEEIIEYEISLNELNSIGRILVV